MGFSVENWRFARLGPADGQAMCGLERECFTLPWSLGQCIGALRQPSFAAFGLWSDKSLIAYVSLYHGAGEMEIINVAVAPAMRRQGLGLRILRLVLQVARKMGMQKASLEVRQSNSAAIALYEKLGFERRGLRRRYYPDTGEDALIYINVLKEE